MSAEDNRKMYAETIAAREKAEKQIADEQKKKQEEAAQELHQRWHPEEKKHADKTAEGHAVPVGTKIEPARKADEHPGEIGGSKDAQHRAGGHVSKSPDFHPRAQTRKP